MTNTDAGNTARSGTGIKIPRNLLIITIAALVVVIVVVSLNGSFAINFLNGILSVEAEGNTDQENPGEPAGSETEEIEGYSLDQIPAVLLNPPNNENFKNSVIELFSAYQGIFNKDNHSLRSFKDASILNEIASLEENHPVRAQIRIDCAGGRGVCETSYQSIYISFPAEQENYSSTKAYVCEGSELFGKNITIVSSFTDSSIQLRAIGNAGDRGEACIGEVDAPGGKAHKNNFVQLSNDHKSCLLGRVAPRRYTKLSFKEVSPAIDYEGCIGNGDPVQ